jgi:hypothetical protein
MLNCEILLFVLVVIIILIVLQPKTENFTKLNDKYILYKAGSIINPKNSIYYIDINNVVLEKGEYHIKMFNKTNHDIVNSLVGKYVIKLDLSKNCKTCRLSCPYQELVYIKKANNEWYVFNYKGELYKINNKKMCMYLDEKLSNLLYKENFSNLENMKKDWSMPFQAHDRDHWKPLRHFKYFLTVKRQRADGLDQLLDGQGGRKRRQSNHSQSTTCA